MFFALPQWHGSSRPRRGSIRVIGGGFTISPSW